jgi:hypothetical protein
MRLWFRRIGTSLSRYAMAGCRMGVTCLFLVEKPKTLMTDCGADVRRRGHHGPLGDDLGVPLPQGLKSLPKIHDAPPGEWLLFLLVVFFFKTNSGAVEWDYQATLEADGPTCLILCLSY